MEEHDHARRVMLVDDHATVREGVRALLERAGYEIPAEAGTGREALERLTGSPVDLVVMDVSMPGMDGIEATAALRERSPDARVLMLSMHATEGHARRAAEAGARGYCTKESGCGELVAAVRTVLAGKLYSAPKLVGTGALDAQKRLTRRQTQILELIAMSYTSKEIAKHLTISMKTVESHRTALMRQLDLHDLAGLVRYAIRTGLVAADAECPAPRQRPHLSLVSATV